MEAEKFSTKTALRFGWNTFKANSGFFIALFAAVVIVYLGLQALSDITAEMALVSILVGLASWVLQVMISIGLLRIPLKFIDGKKADFGDLLSGGRWFFNYFVASLIYALAVIVGLVLLIVPGIILAIRLQFFGYLIVDKDLGFMDALKKSWAMTKDSTWDLFLLYLTMTLINIAGALALLVGLFVSVPVTILAMAQVYRKLLNAAPAAATPSSASATV